MLDNWMAELQRRKAKFESGEAIREMGKAMSDIVKDVAPEDTQLMQSIISQVGKPRRNGDAWEIGVGDKSRLGNPNDKPPAHTITNFLNYMVDELRKDYFVFEPVGRYEAWVKLPGEAKADLKALRQQGLFGGTPGRSPYFYAQEGSKPEWAASAAKAGITPTRFIEDGALPIFKSWLAANISNFL